MGCTNRCLKPNEIFCDEFQDRVGGGERKNSQKVLKITCKFFKTAGKGFSVITTWIFFFHLNIIRSKKNRNGILFSVFKYNEFLPEMWKVFLIIMQTEGQLQTMCGSKSTPRKKLIHFCFIHIFFISIMSWKKSVFSYTDWWREFSNRVVQM